MPREKTKIGNVTRITKGKNPSGANSKTTIKESFGDRGRQKTVAKTDKNLNTTIKTKTVAKNVGMQNGKTKTVVTKTKNGEIVSKKYR